jgi:hypothetical protein
MYSLYFVHPNGASSLRWDLSASGDEDDGDSEDAQFVDCEATLANGFRLEASPDLLTIWFRGARVLELSFYGARMMYILRLFDTSQKMVRELYLEEDTLAADRRYSISY